MTHNFRLECFSHSKFSLSHPYHQNYVFWNFHENLSMWRHYDVIALFWHYYQERCLEKYLTGARWFHKCVLFFFGNIIYRRAIFEREIKYHFTSRHTIVRRVIKWTLFPGVVELISKREKSFTTKNEWVVQI